MFDFQDRIQRALVGGDTRPKAYVREVTVKTVATEIQLNST